MSNRFLSHALAYLSGPMDFIPRGREYEKKHGWRVRMKQFLWAFDAGFIDPWDKPEVCGFPGYDTEGQEIDQGLRESWTYEDTLEGARTRQVVCDGYWNTVHLDFRSIDHANFVIARVPTNIYSVGTPQEIKVARDQCKPVLQVTLPVDFPAEESLRAHLAHDPTALQLLSELMEQMGTRPNPRAIPSLFYAGNSDGTYFFDGFGWQRYRERFPEWEWDYHDEIEERFPPKRPLLPFLESLDDKIPGKFDVHRNQFVPNDDLLIMKLFQAKRCS